MAHQMDQPSSQSFKALAVVCKQRENPSRRVNDFFPPTLQLFRAGFVHTLGHNVARVPRRTFRAAKLLVAGSVVAARGRNIFPTADRGTTRCPTASTGQALRLPYCCDSPNPAGAGPGYRLAGLRVRARVVLAPLFFRCAQA